MAMKTAWHGRPRILNLSFVAYDVILALLLISANHADRAVNPWAAFCLFVGPLAALGAYDACRRRSQRQG